jgi:hypothetical protein
MEPYANRQFRLHDDLDRHSGSGSVPTRTRTRIQGPDPLLTPYGSFYPVNDSRILACPATHTFNSVDGRQLGTKVGKLQLCCRVVDWVPMTKVVNARR